MGGTGFNLDLQFLSVYCPDLNPYIKPIPVDDQISITIQNIVVTIAIDKKN